MRHARTLLLLALLAAPFTVAQAATVTIEISALRNGDGSVLIALCDEAAYLSASCTYFDRRTAGAGTPIVVNFVDVAAGTYAVQVIHDENDDNEFDTNFLGIPSEGYGFSNNPDAAFGPPDFEAAAIAIDGDRVVVPVRMFYVFD